MLRPREAPVSHRHRRVDRFWSKVNKDGPAVRPDLGPCWVWTGAKSPRGYGLLVVDGRKVRANRHVFTLLGRPLEQGLCACHHCDNPPCVRPDHLFAGTHIDNMRDAAKKGLIPPPYSPEAHARSSKTRAAKPTCPNGHEYAVVGFIPRGPAHTRSCNACRRIHRHKYYLRRRSRHAPKPQPAPRRRGG